MPRVSDILLRSVVYLYPTEESAHTGEGVGGTAFLLGMDSDRHPDPDRAHVYAVTNRHVVQDYQSPVIIGPGDDVVVVNRFIDFGGRNRNEPCVRTGVISMMPSEPILDKYGHLQECLLVEVRALRGSSGSPVIVQIRGTNMRQTKYWVEEIDRISKEKGDITTDDRLESLRRLRGASGDWLLGVAFGDIPERLCGNRQE